jgi:opacity protein-like surface antigen
MKKLLIASVALVMVSGAAQAQDRFQRPDCSKFQGGPKAEGKCFRETKEAWKFANYDAVQKAGLEFIYMARPDLSNSPAVKKALEDKVEGSYTIKYSVNQNGTVYDVKVEDVTSAGIEPIAKLWADTIKQWTFAKIAKPVVNVEYRRIYLYSKDDEAEEAKKKHEND